MRLNNLIIPLISVLAIACNKTEESKKHISLDSDEYKNRIRESGVKQIRVVALVPGNSDISEYDSVLLHVANYLNGNIRSMIYNSYSPVQPGIDEYPYSTIDRHNIFDIPYDYKSLCFKSKYAFDSIGNLRYQMDSVDERRSYQYRHRSGLAGKDVIELGNDSSKLYRESIKYFTKTGKDSVYREMHFAREGGFVVYRYYDWINDSTYKLYSKLITDTSQIRLAKLNPRSIKSELAYYKMASKENKEKYIMNFLPAMTGFNIFPMNYSVYPDVVEKSYWLDPKRFVEIKFNKAWLSYGTYDSTITEFDKNDSAVLKFSYINERSRADIPNGEFILSMTTKYKRNSVGQLISLVEDNHILGGNSTSNFKYEFSNKQVIKKEETTEWTNSKGIIQGKEVIVTNYDLAGNITEVESRYTSYDDESNQTKRVTIEYDHMGNKTKEVHYQDGVLMQSMQWKFNKDSLLSEYVYSNKEKGQNQRIVWLYKK